VSGWRSGGGAEGGARVAAIAGPDGITQGGDAVAQRLAMPHVAGPGGDIGGRCRISRRRCATRGRRAASRVAGAKAAGRGAQRLMAPDPAALTTPDAPPLRQATDARARRAGHHGAACRETRADRRGHAELRPVGDQPVGDARPGSRSGRSS